MQLVYATYNVCVETITGIALQELLSCASLDDYVPVYQTQDSATIVQISQMEARSPKSPVTHLTLVSVCMRGVQSLSKHIRL